MGARRSRAKRRRSPSPVELRGSSKRKKSTTTRRIPPKMREGEEEGGGKGEEDLTREMPNPLSAPKVEEVPQTISREGRRD